MKTEQLKKAERVLWSLLKSEENRTGVKSPKSTDPAVVAVATAWGDVYRVMRDQQHAESEAADKGEINWEVFMPGGRREVGTPTKHVIHFSPTCSHENFEPSPCGDIRFKMAMGHLGCL